MEEKKGMVRAGWEGEVRIGPDLTTMRESKGLNWLTADVDLHAHGEEKGYAQISYPSGTEEKLEGLKGNYVIGFYPGDDREIRVIAEYIGRGVGMKHDDITIEVPTFRLTTYPVEENI